MQFSSTFYNEADTTVTIKQIAKGLKSNLKRKFPDKDNDWLNEVTEQILEKNGIDFNHFNFIHIIEKVISEQLNDVSIDDNSNKNEKTIAGIYAEAVAPIKKVVGFDYLYRVMKEMYGKPRAKRLASNMYDYSIGLSDSTNILLPYCYALDASKLVTIGREFGQLPSKPAKRISSYISALCETVHQMSSHFAGAIAIGTFFFDVAHLAYYKTGLSIDQITNDPKCRKHFENEYQQFIHSVNHLSRNSNESPFTNVSIFDKVKLRHIIKEDLAWYFPNPHTGHKIGTEEVTQDMWLDFMVNYIYEIQNIFLDLFDKGDPMNDGSPYRFPVVTANFSKSLIEDGWKLDDEEFLENITSRDVYRYNIFNSEGTKVASCCRLISDTEMLELAAQSNSFGAGAVGSLGSHRVATINFNRIALEASSIEEFWKIYNQRIIDSKDILKAHKTLIQMLANKGLQMFISNGWINMKRMFSTFGILGIYECERTLREKFSLAEDYDITKDILIHLNSKVIEFTKSENGYVFNIEQIPSESYAVRLACVDKLLYGEESVPYQLYANQWVPLWEDATIWEKLEVDGKYNSLLTGGGIVHATIGETVTPTQAKQIINYAVKSGCEHFALNAIYSKCENSHMTMGDITTCPICNGEIIDKYTRVVGFFTPVSSWNKTRREWEFPRRTKVKF